MAAARLGCLCFSEGHFKFALWVACLYSMDNDNWKFSCAFGSIA